MKLGLQGWFLAQPHTGIGQHCLGLLRELAKRPEARAIIPVPVHVKHKGIPRHWIKVVPQKWWIPHPSLRKWYWESVQVPAFFADHNPDWELYPYPCPLPRYSSNLRAMTVHDTILWDDDRYAGGRMKKTYHKKAQRSMVDMDQIFTVSEATRHSLGIQAAKVVHNAVEVSKNLTPSAYKGDLVYLGGYDIRKKVPELVKAFKKVRKAHPNMRLVLIGKPHHKSKYYPEIPEQEGVVWTGPLTDRQVYSILNEAFALVHFSDSEGFNLPLLQAMAVGTPVIARDIHANREVSAGSAVLMKKPSGKALLEAVNYVRRQRKRIIGNQRKAAKQFSWKKSVTKLLKALK